MADRFGARSRPSGGGAQHGRTARRLFAAAAALLLVAVAVSCGSSSGGTPEAPRSSWAVISIPTGQNGYVQCMLDLGWVITEIVTPETEGGVTGYGWTQPGVLDSGAWERSRDCQSLMPLIPTLSPDELHQLYGRWVGEYQCLIGLGYQPNPPPSEEAFVAAYGSPKSGDHLWSPIDGVDTGHWTKAQYDEAKVECKLEFFSDTRYLH